MRTDGCAVLNSTTLLSMPTVPLFEQKVTVGEPERDGRLRRPRTMSKTIHQVPLLVESALNVRTVGSGSKVSLLSKIARSVLPVYAINLSEMVGNMITGFLKKNCMILTTSSGDNVGRISARPAWIPLKKRKTNLMMHEITVGCINTTVPFRFGLTKVDQRKNDGSRFRKRASPCTRICIDKIVGYRQSSTCTSPNSSS